jgi:hypothetical protein
MAYILTTTMTRPNTGVQWWNQANTDASARYTAFMNTFTGVTSVTSAQDPADATKWVSTVTFTDQQARENFSLACATNVDWQSRNSYFEANHITVVRAITTSS